MNFQALFTFALLAVTVYLFVSERLRVDLVALLALAALAVTGILEPEAALAGFANPATVTIAALFVLSAALLRSGAGQLAGQVVVKLFSRGQWIGLALLMVGVGAISAFVNNTAAVAMLMPVVLGVCAKIGASPSKLLMPLSFASMFGGVCTLIGTSTNLLVSQIAAENGARPFGMFEFAPLGLVFFALGVAYMLTVGDRLLPDRGEADDLTRTFEMADYLTDFTLREEGTPRAEGEPAGVRLDRAPVVRELDLDVLEVRRDGRRLSLPRGETVLLPGDVLRVRSTLEGIRELAQRDDVSLAPSVRWRDEELDTDDILLLEVVIPTGSALAGNSLQQAGFRNTFGATVLAIRHHGKVVHDQLKKVRLAPGDSLLLEVRRNRLAPLRASRDLIIVSEGELAEFRSDKLVTSGLILTAVVATAALGILPIVVSALAGCVALVLTRCLSLEEAYAAVDWRIVFLLAGVLGLGRALEETGGAAVLSDFVVTWLAPLGPVAVLAGLYLLTSLLTEAMSNNATAVLLAPVAIATAGLLGVDSRPFLMAVTFAASASFMTPVGYQTNTLVYGPGRYRFGDYLRVGLPLNLIFWVTATLLIPRIWPF